MDLACLPLTEIKSRQSHAHSQSDVGNSFIESPSFQVTIDCIKLTIKAPAQHLVSVLELGFREPALHCYLCCVIYCL